MRDQPPLGSEPVGNRPHLHASTANGCEARHVKRGVLVAALVVTAEAAAIPSAYHSVKRRTIASAEHVQYRYLRVIEQRSACAGAVFVVEASGWHL
jgi:hypothetical protein